MSFQITVLKVLAGHPGGRASLDDLRRAVAILISSGSDWTIGRSAWQRAPPASISLLKHLFCAMKQAGKLPMPEPRFSRLLKRRCRWRHLSTKRQNLLCCSLKCRFHR